VSDGVEVQRGSDPLNLHQTVRFDERCTVSVLNRTAKVQLDGSFKLPNVPANFGQVRARATCIQDGITLTGQSDFFTVLSNGTVKVPDITFTTPRPIPEFLTATALTTILASAGVTTQLTVTASFPDGSTKNVSAASTGTSYTNSNPKVATVSPDGLVTAVSSGTVIISALNEGALGLIRLLVALAGGDSDGDGIPDDVELANGLNPNDPTDGFADFDGDGLTNKQELVDFGTNPRIADTDGDGLVQIAHGAGLLEPGPQRETEVRLARGPVRVIGWEAGGCDLEQFDRSVEEVQAPGLLEVSKQGGGLGSAISVLHSRVLRSPHQPA